MVHYYKNNGYNIVLDVESGAVHVVDEPMYDLIAEYDRAFGNEGGDTASPESSEVKKAVLSKISETHPTLSKEELEELYAEFSTLVEEGSLFSEGDYENRVQAYLTGKRLGKPVVKAMCLHIAHDCNLACKYCFAGGGEYNGGKRELMSYETGKAALDFLVANSANRRNLEVDFFGGEPLMNFEVVKQLVAYGRSLEQEHDKNFRFTLTTNGVLLNDEIMDFLNEEMDNVVLSIDGRREINDLMRPFLDRKRMQPDTTGSSYDTIVPKFKRFKEKRKGKYYIRGTFTRNNLDFSQDVFHLRELGFDSISVEPVVAKESDDYALRREDLPKLFEEYDILAKRMADIAGTEEDFTFFHFMIDLEGGPCVYKRLSGCGSGTEYLAVTPTGELYPCHQFVGNTDFLMGDVFSGIRREDIVEDFSGCNVYSKPKCRDCFAKYYCSGGCAANSYNFHGNIHDAYDIGCELQKKRIECAIMVAAHVGLCAAPHSSDPVAHS